MNQNTRRDILRLLAMLPVSFFAPGLLHAKEFISKETREYPETVSIIQSACLEELTAHKHYIGYSKKAVEEKYLNIAYLFSAFSVSEKIHADNYQKLLVELGNSYSEQVITTKIDDTKKNLQMASEKEWIKIHGIYPAFLKKLEKESYNDAIINCMWSWKSHQQHEKEIKKIRRYSKLFFSFVSRKIESSDFDFHVCRICGSTVDEKPEFPCEICNYPVLYYESIPRPA